MKHPEDMHLGKRIELRLKELGWTQVDLCNRVPGLEPGALNATIKRNSRKNQYSHQIADVLGVHIAWLIDGVDPKYPSYADTDMPVANLRDGLHSIASTPAQSLIDLIVDMDHRKSLPEATVDAVKALLSSIDRPQQADTSGTSIPAEGMAQLDAMADKNRKKY